MGGNEMSDGVKLAIMMIILCILIAIVFGVIQFVKAQTDAGTNNLEETVTAVGDTDMEQYDNTVRSGSQVTSFVKLNLNRDMGVIVHTRKNPVGVNYGRLFSGTQGSKDGAGATVPQVTAISGVWSGFTPKYLATGSYGAAWVNGADADAGPGSTIRPGNAGSKSVVPGVPTAYIANGFADTVSHNANVSAMAKTAHVDFVNPTAKFNSYLIRDISDQVIGVVFIQQGTTAIPTGTGMDTAGTIN